MNQVTNDGTIIYNVCIIIVYSVIFLFKLWQVIILNALSFMFIHDN